MSVVVVIDPRTVILTVLVGSFLIYPSVVVVTDPRTVPLTVEYRNDGTVFEKDTGTFKDGVKISD